MELHKKVRVSQIYFMKLIKNCCHLSNGLQTLSKKKARNTHRYPGQN